MSSCVNFYIKFVPPSSNPRQGTESLGSPRESRERLQCVLATTRKFPCYVSMGSPSPAKMEVLKKSVAALKKKNHDLRKPQTA